MAQATIGVTIRISVEDDERKNELLRQGIGSKEIFLAGLNVMESEVKNNLAKNEK